MLFNSYIFILLFLPLCLVGYYILNMGKKYTLAKCFLLGMSLWFYGYFHPVYLVIILASVGVNFLMYKLISKEPLAPKATMEEGQKKLPLTKRKVLMIAGVALNLAALIYFKYMDFFISNVNWIFKTDIPLLRILLPLGISFFTFQQVSFVIDAYKGEVPEYGLLDYACFVTYFPQLIAGPIVTHDELVPQLISPEKKKLSWDNLARGFYIFTLGLSKKVLLADVFGGAVNWGYKNLTQLDSTNAILVMLAYTIQIYFDFSGYCDMAIGIGKMMGIDIPVNFNSPYKARTITEFWDRWHITLTRFFTRYVYIPLGGNRRGKARTYVNIMIVFFLSGLWHGAEWSFVLWGLAHGAFSCITRAFRKFFDKIPAFPGWLITFIFVNLTWVLFRADNIKDALLLYKGILSFKFGPVNGFIIENFRIPETSKLHYYLHFENIYIGIVMVAFFIIAMAIILFSKNAKEKMDHLKPSVLNIVVTAVLFVWCVLSLSGISTFLYFNF